MTVEPYMVSKVEGAGHNDPVRLAMVTCVKNESELIWPNLHYHHAIGVSKVYVYLDSCSDDTLSIVQSIPWVEPIIIDPELASMCVYISSKQRCAMDDSLRRAREDGFDWLMMIDVDEFAFADNSPKPGLSEHESILWRANLLQMLTELTSDIEMVRLKTVESVPCAMDESTPFWKQHYFQSATEVSFTRELFDPRSNKRIIWTGGLGHDAGKSIVRIAVDVQSHGPHSWVKNQQLPFPRAPARIPLKAVVRGHHFHYWAYNRRHLREKFRKFDWTPSFWRTGVKVLFPVQLFKELSVQMSEQEIFNYVDDYVFLPKDELDRYVFDGVLISDDTVERIFEASHFSSLQLSSIERPVDQGNPIDQLNKNDFYRENFSDVPLLPTAPQYAASDFAEPFFTGVYWLELNKQNRPFRWCGPEAEIKLRMNVGDYWLIIEIGEFDLIDLRSISFEFNDHKICSSDIWIGGSSISLALSSGTISGDELQVLRCRAPIFEDTTLGELHKRELSFPIFALSLQPFSVVGFASGETFRGLASWPQSWLLGFNSHEAYQGKSFRWTKSNAYLPLIAEPDDYLLVLNLERLIGLVDTNRLQVSFNGKLLPRKQIEGTTDGVPFFLSSSDFEDSIFQRLHIKADPLDTSSWERKDTRELGIPLFGIELRPSEPDF